MADRPRSFLERWFGKPKPPASLDRGMRLLQQHIQCLEARGSALATLETETAARVRRLHASYPGDPRVVHAFTELAALRKQSADLARTRAMLSKRLYGLQNIELAQLNVDALGRVRDALGRSVATDIVVDLDTALSDLVTDTDDTAGLSEVYNAEPEPDIAAGLAAFLGTTPTPPPLEELPGVPDGPPSPSIVVNPVSMWLGEEA